MTDDRAAGVAMCKAWGLDPALVCSIRLVFEPGQRAIAHVVLLPNEDVLDLVLELDRA